MFNGPSLPPVVAIVGPTAVGKSRMALDLAARFDADIVTVDSRQVYRYMDIGTAKPTAAERSRVAHYMLDLVEPSETYSVERFRQEARRVLARIGAAGRVALAVGGTGFYFRALLDGPSFPSVAPNQALRAALREEAQGAGADVLHERLARVDPVSARRIHPHNVNRVIRALEIVDALGSPVPGAESGDAIRTLYLGLGLERGRLHAEVDRRVIEQVEAGLVDETRMLLSMGYEPDCPGLSGFGYRHMVEYLRGDSTLQQAIAGYQAATRQYARRQLTWFRADSRIRWLDALDDRVAAASASIAAWLTSASSGVRSD